MKDLGTRAGHRPLWAIRLIQAHLPASECYLAALPGKGINWSGKRVTGSTAMLGHFYRQPLLLSAGLSSEKLNQGRGMAQ